MMVRNGYLRSVLAKGLDTPLRYHLKVVCPTDSDSHARVWEHVRVREFEVLISAVVTYTGHGRWNGLSRAAHTNKINRAR